MDELANKAAVFLPYYEIDSQHDGAALFLRGYIYIPVIIPLLPKNLCTFDRPKIFEAQYGFPLIEFCEFVFLFFTHAITIRGKKSLDAALNSGLNIGLFKNSTIPHKAIERVFGKVSFTLDELNAVPPKIGFGDFDYPTHPPSSPPKKLFPVALQIISPSRRTMKTSASSHEPIASS
jgi:hypothetical protein